MSRDQSYWYQNGDDCHSTPHEAFDVKRLQCWYWTHGRCIWGDQECRYAHQYTGKVADKPIMKANASELTFYKGYSVAGRNATVEQPVYRKWQGGTLHHSSSKTSDENEEWNQRPDMRRSHHHRSAEPDHSYYTHQYDEFKKMDRRGGSGRYTSAEEEGSRGRLRFQDFEEPYETNYKQARSRSSSPRPWLRLKASRERSPANSPRKTTSARKPKADPGHKEGTKPAAAPKSQDQTAQAITNKSANKDDNSKANTKHIVSSQAQTGSSPLKADPSTQYPYTSSLPQPTNIAPAENDSGTPDQVSRPPVCTAPYSAPTTHVTGPQMDATYQSVSFTEKQANGNADYLHVQPELHQQYTPIPNQYHGSQSFTQRNAFNYTDQASTMVTMTMGQYNQMRAYQDHMKRELSHYRIHHRRAEQVIEYQNILLTEAQSLLESGRKLLTDEGRLAMDLSQRIQRGETIHPDHVTDAWLGATDMLRQADSFSTMLDEWSRGVSAESSRNGSSSAADPAAMSNGNLPAPVANGDQ